MKLSRMEQRCDGGRRTKDFVIGLSSFVGSFAEPLTPGLRLTLLALLLLALALRAAPLTAHRFHEDEALYASWALLTAEDPALISVPVDKPPLHIYLLAGFFRLLGPSETAARLSNLLASVISVALLYAVGRRAYDRPTALVATMLYTASPFAILFAPTAFTDPLLVLWMLLGLWAALAGRPFLAGLALGLAYATKQQGVLLAPLVVAVSVWRGSGRDKETRGQGDKGTSGQVGSFPSLLVSLSPYLGSSAQMMVGFLPLFASVTWWDALRWHVQPSFWDRSLATYGGLILVPPAAWPERLADWAQLLGYIFVSPLLNAILLIGLPALLWLAIRPYALRATHHKAKGPGTGAAPCPLSLAPCPTSCISLLLTTYVAAYFLLHLALSFQVWDRYLLPLVPLLCLLLARSIGCLLSLAHRLYRRFRVSGFGFQVSAIHYPISTRRSQKLTADCQVRRFPAGLDSPAGANYDVLTLLIAALIIVLIRPAWLGASSQLPVGGDHGAYDGIDRLAAYVQTHLPPGATLYYHWLGWHLDYYLHDVPLKTVWYPDPQSLTELAAAHRHEVQAIVFPAWKDDRPVHQALAARGLLLTPCFTAYRGDGSRSFVLYVIEEARAMARSGGVP